MRKKLTNLLGIGMVGLLAGVATGFLKWLKSPWPAVPATIPEDPNTWVMIGVLWDLAFFTAALLSGRFLLMREELKQNIQLNYCLETQKYEIENESLNIRAEAEREKEQSAKDKLEMLRSQINPHFIYNSLTLLSALVGNNEKENALQYILRFSKLLRDILENSHKSEISLNDELEVLRSYIEISQLRFQDFVLKWEIEPGLDCEEQHIPPTTLQPLAENAILHGLRNSRRTDKCLWVCVRSESEFVVIEIRDNGIGRPEPSNVQDPLPGKKSLGLKNTRERILKAHADNAMEIEDLKDAEGNATGTRTTIRLKK